MEQIMIVGVGKDNNFLIDSDGNCYRKMSDVESVGTSVIIEVEGLGYYVSMGKPSIPYGKLITIKKSDLKVK